MRKYRIKVYQTIDHLGRIRERFMPQYKILNLIWYSPYDKCGCFDTEAEARQWIDSYRNMGNTKIIEVV